MQSSLKSIATAAAAALLLAHCGSTTGEPDCTDAGCGTEVALVGVLAKPGVEPIAVSTELCRNGECETIEIAAAVRGECRLVLGGIANVCLDNLGSTWRVTIAFELDSNGARAVDGDQYKVSVREQATRLDLLHFEQTVNYERFRPNGADCEPECRRFTATLGPS